jgi:hypothetical protein
MATPEWERFKGSAQGSSVAWARPAEGALDAMNSMLANNNLTSLNSHPNRRDPNVMVIEARYLPISHSWN